MAASPDGAMKAEDAGVSASACPSSPTIYETLCKEDTIVCSAQSPRLVPEAQLLHQQPMHCGDVASTPGIPSESEPHLKLRASDMSLPPIVDSVTHDMLKISIYHPSGSTEEHLRAASNSGNGHKERPEMSILIPANDNKEGDGSQKEAGAEPESLSSNGHAGIGKVDALSLQNICMVGVNEIGDGMQGSLRKDASELVSDNDDHEDDDEGEEVEVSDNAIDINEVEDVDDSEAEDEQDSDSSSSTSSLSFLSSSDDEYDNEVVSLNRLLNGANNPSKDLVMEEESECEEGELKEPPSQRKKGGLKKKTLMEHSEDDEGLKEPARSKNKEKDLPYVPKVTVILNEYHKMVPVGFVSSVVGLNLIVEAIENQQPLTEGSILWLTDKRLPLGIVDELFGPVKKPFYVVRYNDVAEVPEGAEERAQVSYVRDFADFVLNHTDLYSKGYDESGDEDNSDSEVNFSDDEKEAEYKRSKSRMKRGNSESGTLEGDNRQHQEKRGEGKRLNRDNKNWKLRGENARAFQSNHEFPRRPPRHQNVRFQHHRNERESPSADRVEPMQTFDERNKNGHGNQSPVRQARSQQSLVMGHHPSKPSTPVSSTSDGSAPCPSQVLEPNLITQLCSTSQPVQMNQFLQRTMQQAQLQNIPQPTSQQVQLLHTNQSHNLMQQTPQQIQMNESHGVKQSILPQVALWQAKQPQPSESQPPSIPHSQIPVYSHAAVAGQVPSVAIGGGGILQPFLQPGRDAVQGLPLAYQAPIYPQQQAPTLNQFSASMPHPFSAQGSQVPPNTGMAMGNQIQAVQANAYPVGVQPAALAAPVLGIPAGPASTPFNYPMQMVCNQNFAGFTPAFASPSPPSTYGVPEQARTMQPFMAAASWQQRQQHLPPDSSGPPPQQQPFQQRPHQMRGPRPQGGRF